MKKLIAILLMMVVPSIVLAETYMRFTVIDNGYTGGNIENKRNRTGIDKFEHQGVQYPNIDRNLVLVQWEKNGLLMYKLDVSTRTANRMASSFEEYDATVLSGRDAHGLINNYFHYSGVTIQ